MSAFAELAQQQKAHFAQLRAERPVLAKAEPLAATKMEEPAHIKALRLALPIAQRAASVAPTTHSRVERAHQAAKAVEAIRAALADYN